MGRECAGLFVQCSSLQLCRQRLGFCVFVHTSLNRSPSKSAQPADTLLTLFLAVLMEAFEVAFDKGEAEKALMQGALSTGVWKLLCCACIYHDCTRRFVQCTLLCKRLGFWLCNN